MPRKLTLTVAVDRDGVALGGMDPVSYFMPQGPTQGDPAISEPFDGARWLFASETNRAAFREHPARYTPQFGGHCVFGAARGQAFTGSPKAWTVEDEHLYLSKNRLIRALMGPNPARIAAAAQAWSQASLTK